MEWCDASVLSDLTPQHVDRLRGLSDQKFPDSEARLRSLNFSLFLGTIRIVRHHFVLQIASASTATFFCHCVEELAYAGGSKRVLLLYLLISRPRK